PDSWVIAIHRDGRDVARSLAEVSFGAGSITAAATTWRSITEAIERDAPRCSRFRDVRYEDLLADPVSVTSALWSWVGLEVDDAAERALAYRAANRVSRYNSTGDVGSGKWRELSRRDLWTVYRHAGDRLVAMGYVTVEELAQVRRGAGYR